MLLWSRTLFSTPVIERAVPFNLRTGNISLPFSILRLHRSYSHAIPARALERHHPDLPELCALVACKITTHYEQKASGVIFILDYVTSSKPSPEQHPDDIILHLLAADDERAIDMLHARYYKRLFFAVRKLLRNDEDTANILNDLLVAIWKKRHTLTLRKPLLYYLYKAARNRAVNVLRPKTRARETQPDHQAAYPQLEDPADQADARVREADLIRMWHAAEYRMPYRVREAFVLSWHRGLTPEEIAVEMNITVSGARKNLARAWKIIEAVKKTYF